MTYSSKHTEILTPEEGYNLTETEYQKYWPHLDSFYSINFNRLVPRARKDFHILDLGAGDGRMYRQLNALNPNEYIACDCSQNLLSKHPGRIKKIVCNLEENRPFEDQYFDLLSAFFLIEHIENIDHFFSEASRILKDNGQLFIGYFFQKRLFTWNVKGKRFKIEQFPHSIEELEIAAQENGFKVTALPLFDVCNARNQTGQLLICEK